ncbi:MAG TPA: CAP domain-containing protein [Solirubrobacteraceae bacterium]|nr:CAP domain-containing protein [Solirubrobacteraceae bacterium]
MARHRAVCLACACALAACAYVPATSAFAAGRASVARYRAAGGHAARKHHRGCRRTRSRGPAKRASYRVGGHARHGHRSSGCARHHSARRHAKTHRPRHTPAAAHSSVCTNADLTPSAANLDLIDVATLCLVNRERAGHGEGALRVDGALACAAQKHSHDMASEDYFEHVGPSGDTPVTRMRACGYGLSSGVAYEAGENIAWGTLWLATPRSIVAAWMASPGHRANILDGQFRDTGIGVSPHPLASLANGQPGAIYTQDFGVTFG